MKVGITGGRGFLAYNLFLHLAETASEAPDIHLYLDDVCDGPCLIDFSAEVDVLLHIAAYTDTKKAEREPDRCFEVNVTGTLNALAATRKAGIKMVYVSSAEVHEDLPGAYRESKRQADAACVEAFERDGQDVVIARPYNLYGYRQNPEKLIPRFIRQATFGEPLLVQGEGSQRRDYVFGLDCADAVWRLKDTDAGTAVDVATGRGATLSDIASLVQQAVSSPYRSLTVRGMKAARDEPQDMIGSYQQLENATGWRPATPLEDGIKNTVAWYEFTGHLTPIPIRSRRWNKAGSGWARALLSSKKASPGCSENATERW
ncbi:MAG: NAD(P)-dependent oxidoreductase [Actinobacteria bacterium]|nr:NAD(P)-dependent oxidoreductase [Actinomycetota bacterium]